MLAILVGDYELSITLTETVGYRALKAEMEEQGTQSGLAERFGMSKGAISEIINGKKTDERKIYDILTYGTRHTC